MKNSNIISKAGYISTRLIVPLVMLGFSVLATQVQAGDPVRGQSVYIQHCTQCHGGDGAGIISGTPSFRAGSMSLMKSDIALIQIIRQGKGIMPGYNGKLQENEMYDAIAYIRTFF